MNIEVHIKTLPRYSLTPTYVKRYLFYSSAPPCSSIYNIIELRGHLSLFQQNHFTCFAHIFSLQTIEVDS